MPFNVPLPEKPQHGAGTFKNNNVFAGLAGMRFAYQTTLGWLLPNLGVKLGQVPAAKSGGTALDPVQTAAIFATGTEAVLDQIGKGLSATQSGVADEHVTHAAALGAMAGAIAQGARDTHAVKKHVNRRTAPQVITRYVKPNIKAAVAPYAKATAEANARAKIAERKAAELEQRVAALERRTAAKSAIAVPGFGGKTGEWDRWRSGVEKRLGKLGKAAGLGAFLLLLSKALEKIGANWIRCSNVKQYGKRLCGMDQGLLSVLLAESLIIASSLSLRDLTNQVLGVEDQIVAGIRKYVRELHGVDPIREGGYTGTVDGRT